MSIVCFGSAGFTCAANWIIIVLLFFIAAILRKQLGDFVSMDFSLPAGAGVGILSFIVIFLISKSTKWSFVISLVFLLGAGFLLGPYFGGEAE